MTTKQEMRQLLDSEALNHICALATEHNADLPQWCARRRRYEAFRRMAVAACFFALLAVGADTVYARPPLYTEIYTCGNIDNDHACKTIDYMLNH